MFAAAEPLSEAGVLEFRVNLLRHHYRQDLPYLYIPQVAQGLTLQHMKRLEANWDKLSLTFRQEYFRKFKEAGLERFFWLMLLESGADPNKVSPAGAIGLYQVMPSSAREICGLGTSGLYDPSQNAECALKIMKRCQHLRGWQAQAICYNGKLAVCPNWKGYQKCLAKKAAAGSKGVMESLTFATKLFVYQHVGEHFFKKDL